MFGFRWFCVVLMAWCAVLIWLDDDVWFWTQLGLCSMGTVSVGSDWIVVKLVRCGFVVDWFGCMFRFMKLVWFMDCCLSQASCYVHVKLLQVAGFFFAYCDSNCRVCLSKIVRFRWIGCRKVLRVAVFWKRFGRKKNCVCGFRPPWLCVQV